MKKAMLALMFIGLVIATNSWGEPRSKIFFFVATDWPQLLDDQTCRFVAEHGVMLILNAPYQATGAQPKFIDLVNRFHQLKPNFPVFMYSWLSRFHDTQRIGGTVLAGYRDQPILGLDRKDPFQKNRILTKSVLFGDVTSTDHRRWIVDRIRTNVNATNADGVFLDSVHRSPPGLWLGNNKSFPDNYGKSMDELVAGVSSAVKPRKVIYNGLVRWSDQEKSLIVNQENEKLLHYANGVLLEHFGRHANRTEIPPFDKGVLFLADLTARHPDKLILVTGRGPWTYTTYREDYLWQRYVYCGYLLCCTPNTLFKYLATFQEPTSRGRSGALDYYADWDLDIGNPQGTYEKRGDIYVRMFEKGTVVVAPREGSGGEFLLTGPMTTPEGQTLNGRIKIEPGVGMILLKKSSDHHRLKISFPTDSPLSGQGSAIHLRVESDNKSLKISSSGIPAKPRAVDLPLETKRSLLTSKRLSFRLRSRDPSSKILVRCEVDDGKRMFNHLVIEIAANGQRRKAAFMARDVPRGLIVLPSDHRNLPPYLQREVPYVRYVPNLRADGEWQTVRLEADQISNMPSRYTIRRWVSMRVAGTLDLHDIVVSAD